MKLPTEKKKPTTDVATASMLFFGSDKVGKTSFVNQFPDNLILECNPGNADHLERNSIDIYDWEQAVEVFAAINENPTYCKTLIIDELPRLYSYLYHWTRKQLHMKDTDKDDFDVWRTVRNILTRSLNEIKKLPCGKIFTANEESQIVPTRKGDVGIYDINMNPSSRDVLHGYFTLRGYIYTRDGERFMIIDGDSSVNVGHCFENHFTVNSQRLNEFSLGFSPSEAFENFQKAFRNEMPGKVCKVKTPPKSVVLSAAPPQPEKISEKLMAIKLKG